MDNDYDVILKDVTEEHKGYLGAVRVAGTDRVIPCTVEGCDGHLVVDYMTLLTNDPPAYMAVCDKCGRVEYVR